MHYQDQIIKTTKYATDSLFRISRAMPEDKINWKPLDNGRTVIDQLQKSRSRRCFF